MRDPHEVEAETGLPVFSTIPLSPAQAPSPSGA